VGGLSKSEEIFIIFFKIKNIIDKIQFFAWIIMRFMPDRSLHGQNFFFETHDPVVVMIEYAYDGTKKHSFVKRVKSVS
jgi:hypothetical protein